jgi:type I restriction-modification system DNA methylase subunit
MTPARAEDRDAGRRAVIQLSTHFAENLRYYKSAQFDETSCRQRFIDPFFAALGWDVADEERRGPFADVVLEYSLRTDSDGTRQQRLAEAEEEEEEEDQRVAQALASNQDPGKVGMRRPDYAFRIAGDDRFFVEAKRPSVEINSPRPIFQVKSYGWNADIPIVILTDFEDILVYDCRYRPALDKPLTGLVPEFKLNFSEYESNWDLLWDTFSRNSVAGGSLGRFAEEIADRKGQLPVDLAFLNDLSNWRQALARDLAKNNPQLDVWNLNDATQLILDRLVFIRVCEDRGLESAEVLRPLLNSSAPYTEFVSAIKPLRASYNGGLLDPHLADELTVSRAVFTRIIRGLYTPWAPYRFDALAVDILGSIYERALGSMITLGEDRTVKVELKPEVRKAGGVYYTPQWVVEQIIRWTIDPLLAKLRPAQLATFRVLDPACGSGSFLLAVFERLVRHCEHYYTAHPTVERQQHLEDEQGLRRLTSAAKAKLLKNCIYGVDVDPAAVEVTTMSLYLKSLESDAPEHIRSQMQFTGAILPLLTDNIKCGNSLVSTDFYQQTGLSGLDPFEEHRLRPFKWESVDDGFGIVLGEGGFDAIVGNPPYYNVDITYGANHPVPQYLKSAYSAIWQDKTDIYYFFLAKAVSLARQRVGFIVSRSFLEADKARRTRQFLAQNARLQEIADLDGFRVFPEAGIATAMVVFDASQPHHEESIDVRRLDSAAYSTYEVANGLQQNSSPFEVFSRKLRLGEDPWRFPNPFVHELFQRIDSAGVPFGDVCLLGKGMETAANQVFGKLSDQDVEKYGFPAELLRRRARNSDIHRYYVDDSGENVLYLEDVDQYSQLPASVRGYLEEATNRAALEKRAAYRRGDCEWWRYTFPLHKELYGTPHLVSPYRTGHNRFARDDGFSYFASTDTTVVFRLDGVDEDLRYIEALLNSKALTFRFRGLAKLTSPGMWESIPYSLEELPIRRINFDKPQEVSVHDDLVHLSSELASARVAAKQGLSAADRSLAFRRSEGLLDEVDALVLDLYDIRQDEGRSSALALGAPLS